MPLPIAPHAHVSDGDDEAGGLPSNVVRTGLGAITLRRPDPINSADLAAMPPGELADLISTSYITGTPVDLAALSARRERERTALRNREAEAISQGLPANREDLGRRNDAF